MIATQGTLEDWRRAANMLFASGCEAQSFAVLASIAAPLMPLWKRKDAGAVVSIWGKPKSGKSTAIAGATSVWGLGTVIEFNDQIPFLSENLINGDPTLVREVVTDSVSGGKTIIVSSGMSLFAAISSPNDPFRLGVEFEVAVPAGLKQARDKNEIEFTLYSNYGHAGAAMMEELADEKRAQSAKRLMSSYLRGMEESVSSMDKYDADVAEKYRLAKSVETMNIHALRMIATARAAGDIAVKLKLLEIDPERIARWAFSKYGGPT